MAELPYPVLLFFFAMIIVSVALVVIGLKLRGSFFFASRWSALGWAILCALPFFASYTYTHSFEHKSPEVSGPAPPTPLQAPQRPTS